MKSDSTVLAEDFTFYGCTFHTTVQTLNCIFPSYMKKIHTRGTTTANPIRGDVAKNTHVRHRLMIPQYSRIHSKGQLGANTGKAACSYGKVRPLNGPVWIHCDWQIGSYYEPISNLYILRTVGVVGNVLRRRAAVCSSGNGSGSSSSSSGKQNWMLHQ